jgi:hypothetical protein
MSATAQLDPFERDMHQCPIRHIGQNRIQRFCRVAGKAGFAAIGNQRRYPLVRRPQMAASAALIAIVR